MTGSADGELLTDVEAADGSLLAARGTVVDAAFCQGLCARGRAEAFADVGIATSCLPGDMEAVTREENYAVVFDCREEAQSLLEMLGGLRVRAPILRELERARLTDAYTYRHVLMTTLLSARMLRDLGASLVEVLEGAYAALTHDIGKFRVPLDVLQKPTALTRSELAVLQQHPMIGHLLLLYYLGEAGTNAQVALGHHERPDGSGYPQHVQLADRLVRLIAVNDIFDALISPRPYRQQAFDTRGALEFLWAEVKAGRVDEAGCRLLVSYNRHNKPEPWSMVVSDDVRSPPPRENQYGRICDG